MKKNVVERDLSKRQGFTLIELLVVIAIIAILASILFPVFARARAMARKSSCLSNEKQIALGFMMYMQDYDSRFPQAWDTIGEPHSHTRPSYVMTPADAPLVWPAKLMPYVKSRQIFTCPSRTTDYGLSSCGKSARYGQSLTLTWKAGDPVVGSRIGYSHAYRGASSIGYGYNVNYLGGGQYAGIQSIQHVKAPSATKCYTCGIGASQSSIAKPSETILIIDNNYQNRGSGSAPAFMDIEEMGRADGDLWCRADGSTYDAYDTIDNRHLGGVNVAFADGHVKWMKKSVAAYKPSGLGAYSLASYGNDPKFLWDRQ